MRKIVLVLAVCCAMMAQAADYPYLVFTSTAGTTTSLSVSNMTLKVNGAQLDVTNAEGTVNFTLTELASMEFSATDPTTALENVLDGDKPVQVYSINGMSLGSFSSLVQAVQQLDKGVYIMVQNGKSQKLIVR